jgi:transcriptional regulator with XRE-family HTH domain
LTLHEERLLPAIYVKANLAWAAAIRAVRAKARLTQGQLADALGINQQDVSKLETGRRPLRAAEIPVLAKACKMTPQGLFDVFKALYEA